MKRQVCLVLLVMLEAYWWTQPAGPMFTVFAALLVIGAVVRPMYGVVAFAAIAPMSTMVASWCGAPGLGADLLTRIALAIVAGVIRARPALISYARSDTPSDTRNGTRIGPPAFVMSIVAIASAIVMIPAAAAPWSDDALLRSVIQLPSARSSPVWAPLFVALTSAVCLWLGWAVERLVRHSPQLAERLLFAGLIGHAVSATLGAHSLLRAAVHSADPMAALPRLLMSVRLSLQTDWNAAASALLLAGIAGFGLAKARGFSRIYVITMITLVGLGIWITGSRVAIVLAILTTIGTLGWLGVRTSRHRFALIGGVALVVAAVGGWFTMRYPEGRNDQLGNTLRDRLVLMNAGLEMAEEAPVFGIGVDRFYESSPRYVGANEKPGLVPENAHNNFIQVLAEQGIAGLLALLWMLWTVLSGGLRAQRHQPTTLRAGLLLGMTVCVATWLTGHPLLVPEFTYVFWLYAAMLSALTPAPAPDRISWPAVLALVAVLVSIPVRATANRNNANLEYRGLGVSMWHHDDTQRYRNAGPRFSLFLSATDRPIELPIRRSPGAPDPLMVTIQIDGKPVNRITVEGDAWRTVQITVPRGSSQFKEVDFTVEAPSVSAPLPPPVLLRVGKEEAR